MQPVQPVTHTSHACNACARQEYDYHTLEPNMTAADLDAPIATLNLPLLGVLHTLHSSMSPKAQSWADLLAGLIAG